SYSASIDSGVSSDSEPKPPHGVIAHACYVDYTLEGNRHPSNFFVLSRKNEKGGTLLVWQLGSAAGGDRHFSKNTVDVVYSPADDVPLRIQ
ncbi:hypothetical protein PENTCL1PPCAC_11118, partial [Pristionchus entomophagus]